MLFTLVTVVVWLVISIVTSQRQSGIDAQLKNLAKPLNPNLNIEVINRLEQKQTFSPDQLRDFPIYKIIKTKDGKQEQVVTLDVADDNLLSPSPSPSPSAMSSLSPSPSPTILPSP